MVGVVAAFLWGGGFLIGSVGIASHQLWLIYLGYGVLGGCGLGLGYVSPVSTLIRWFPDRRGMATGMAIMGFGGGAMIAAPVKGWLLALYRQGLPEFRRHAATPFATVVPRAVGCSRKRRLGKGRGGDRFGPRRQQTWPRCGGEAGVLCRRHRQYRRRGRPS